MPEQMQKQSVLIVDDDIVNIKILGSALIAEYEILFALSAQEGINSAISNQPDIILLDILMPLMDGYEACRLLKEDERTRDIPVIFITAKDSEEDEAKGFDVGGVDYITKPFSLIVAKARINTHISLNLTSQELASKNIILAARLEELEKVRKEIKDIESIIPICSYCKKIRDDKNYWEQLESYMYKYSEMKFSHSICPDCYEQHIIPQLLPDRNNGK
ncbi:MAG: response regulator [Deltaproteobacteria bacterium HGW-Deltaproteobacteria-10]|nr:MAG: response regulator [Deltaproteobacteria bacterium HGW-Deltaproteobacteria-10]